MEDLDYCDILIDSTSDVSVNTTNVSYNAKRLLPSPAWAEGIVVCVFVCVCVCVTTKLVLSQNLKKLQLSNMIIIIQNTVPYKTEKFFLVKATQIASKLGNKKLIVQVSHERLLNQANGCILLGTLK